MVQKGKHISMANAKTKYSWNDKCFTIGINNTKNMYLPSFQIKLVFINQFDKAISKVDGVFKFLKHKFLSITKTKLKLDTLFGSQTKN